MTKNQREWKAVRAKRNKKIRARYRVETAEALAHEIGLHVSSIRRICRGVRKVKRAAR